MPLQPARNNRPRLTHQIAFLLIINLSFTFTELLWNYPRQWSRVMRRQKACVRSVTSRHTTSVKREDSDQICAIPVIDRNGTRTERREDRRGSRCRATDAARTLASATFAARCCRVALRFCRQSGLRDCQQQAE